MSRTAGHGAPSRAEPCRSRRVAPDAAKPTRRALIRGVLTLATALACPAVVAAGPAGRVGRGRLWAVHAATGETLAQPFLAHDEATQRTLWASWSWFFRDTKDADEAVWIDRRLLGHLADLQVAMSSRRGEAVPLMLVSGYRTPSRNARLPNASRNSFHPRGRAADLWFRGCSHRDVHQAACEVDGVGGVGRYADFTHVDTGPAGRRW